MSFLRSLALRSLRRVTLFLSDNHEDLEATVSTRFKASWPRCRVHFMRALAYLPQGQRQIVPALSRTASAPGE
jgi:transposase-like protein